MESAINDYESERQDALERARNEKFQPAPLNYANNYDDRKYADNYTQDEHKDRLNQSRLRENKLSNAINTAKTLKDIATPLGGVSLAKQINFIGDMPFVAAMGAAMLKDLLDLVTGPTVILAILFSILCSIFIFMMLFLVSSSENRKIGKNIATKYGKKMITLLFGAILESVPAIDFLPIQTITVVIIYIVTLMERKENSA